MDLLFASDFMKTMHFVVLLTIIRLVDVDYKQYHFGTAGFNY